MTVQLPYDDAMEAVDGGLDGLELVTVEDVDRRRWESHHRLILRRIRDDTFWAAHFSQGLTENQDGTWFGHGYRAPEGTMVKFDQVWPKQVVTTVYVSKPPVESV